MLNNIEFYVTPKGEVMVHSLEGVHQYTPSDRRFTSLMMEKVEQLYPQALSAMSKNYQRLMPVPAIFEFTMIRRFIKCNFGKYDSVMDIDHFGNFNFEEVSCPLRGECALEEIVCKPKFNTDLSDREKEIMELYYNGFKCEAIAEKLFISIETVRTHKKNAFRRVNVHSLAEFFQYANKNNLFEN